MKLTLTLALAILLLAATGRGEVYTNQVMLRLEKLESLMKAQTNDAGNFILGTSPPPVAVTCDITMVPDTNGIITLADEGIRKLAASGEICKVFGHWYPNVWIGERKCKLCGKVDMNKTIRWSGGGDGGDGLDLIEGDSDGFRIIKREDRK